MRHNLLILLVSCLLVNACTQKAQDVTLTLNEAFWGLESVNKSQQEINALPYASSYVRLNDDAQVFMVLALVEPSPSNSQQKQLKWVSADGGMLVTENGRLIKTLGLPVDNLAGVNSYNSIDPLLIDGKKPNKYAWVANYDWQPGNRFNYAANLTWGFIGRETIHLDAWDKELDYYQEIVTIPVLNVQFTNHFWLDIDSHQVMKSIQYIGPEMSSVEMTILKPFSG